MTNIIGLRPCPCRMGGLWKGAKRKSNCSVRRLAGKDCCHHLRGAEANLPYQRRYYTLPRTTWWLGQIMAEDKHSQAWIHEQGTDISNTHPARIWNGGTLNLPSSIYPRKEEFLPLPKRGKKAWRVSNRQDLLQLGKQQMYLGTSVILDFLLNRSL